MLRQLVPVSVLLLVALSSSSYSVSAGSGDVMNIKSPKGTLGPKLQTNIALVGAENPLTTIQREEPNRQVLVDPSKLFDHVSEEFRQSDIEEDPGDRFVTTRSGKPRVQLAEGSEDWADEIPLKPNSNGGGRSLVRKKRCGGGDDDGNANRARRARRTRRARVAQRNRVRRERRRARKAARRAARTQTTTITRTILPANQIYPSAQAGALYVQPQNGQMIQTIQQPQTIQTTETLQQPAQVQYITQTQPQPQSPIQFQAQASAMAAAQPVAIGGAVSTVAAA